MAEEKRASKSVVDTKPSKRDVGSYVLQYTMCCKPTCQFAKDGKLHGPYWDLYTKEDGRTRCKYIGKRLPSEDCAIDPAF